MISIQSKRTIDSKTLAGVRFTVRTLNRIQRAKRDFPVAATRQRLLALAREYGPLQAIEEDKRTPEDRSRILELSMEYSELQESVITASVIRAGLVSIEGLEIDGAPATPESLIESAGADYDELIDEITTACYAASGLTAEETKNSESPSTSTAQGAPTETTSSAAPVAG